MRQSYWWDKDARQFSNDVLAIQQFLPLVCIIPCCACVPFKEYCGLSQRTVRSQRGRVTCLLLPCRTQVEEMEWIETLSLFSNKLASVHCSLRLAPSQHRRPTTIPATAQQHRGLPPTTGHQPSHPQTKRQSFIVETVERSGRGTTARRTTTRSAPSAAKRSQRYLTETL